MTTLPPYVIEPPDILLINTLRIVPKPPYQIQTLDGLFIQASGTPENQPIRGIYIVDPNGTVNLGLGYPRVQVTGKTIEEAQKDVQAQLSKILKNTQVELSLAQSRGQQQIQGDHLVRMDGTIGLGVYGSVYVTGMTLDQARQAIETHLSQFIQKPEISLDVYSYNSKWYYIIQDRAGYGQTVIRLPITGRDTVLDALSNMYGIGFFNSNRHMWLARPNGKDPNSMQLFPINWPALTQGGSPATNYQLLPGDRLYVQSNPLIKTNNLITQFLMPVERLLGFELLGTSAVSSTAGTIFEIKSGSTGAGLAGSGVGITR
ncbi:MAG TPA: polysaccharide biosynthesis/export family protein [Gemmataceae bacterium]|nr:polysaccharide biosynthesis/export family protein [Gemmataceae bacterium]